ncbi:MAG TPA: bifunctional D-glycero-beta-D-manno-heptose-7-phosphate kinase/D-glycero-beta-D-manno-heptose 1-phosphate adenylyltransferase HldE [Methylophilaceae bacterium]|nr:bifunctional D-glycero-beta-D-manno-heptose-7-phosphate kinase/D-glycero-beta-D-manno-heptose 1-phosphate adenylyltransferase HldE [Methylophilaceae bacterium]
MQQRLLDTVRHSFGHSDKWALVIGDLMLDRYLIGEVERISPEAPVPIVLLHDQHERAGGAANVAANLAKLGIPTRIAGCIGDDNEGRLLLAIIDDIGIATDAVVKSEHRPTVTKTRILGGHQQQMMRLDQESRKAFSDAENQQLQEQLSAQLAERPAVVILSDYAKGVLSTAVCQNIIQQARQLGIPVLADPKGRDYSKYQGATALTPNKRETAEACGASTHDNPTLLSAAAKLRDMLSLDFLAVTRGEEGISLIDSGETLHIPATAKQVFDVSGAGDTVIATLAAGLIHGLNHQEALQLANIAAGIVVGKVGTVPVTREELLHELVSQDTAEQADKVCDLENLLLKVVRWRAHGERIVFTNGCFDLLHAGHVTYLEAAKKAGDRLILGLNTDRSVSALKGPTRPVIHEADRARVLAALEAVDAVILFDEDTPLNLIHAIKPDVIVKGNDYTEDQVVGCKDVKSWGGKVALIPIVPGRSTSRIIEKLVN